MSQLTTTLKQLKLSGMGTTLELRLQEAGANRLSHREFLELILQDEINLRHQKRIELRTRSAEFTKLKTLEDFDWRFNSTVSRKDISELATGHFIRQGTDVLFVGASGVGKTQLAQAIGYEAIKQGFVVRYRSILMFWQILSLRKPCNNGTKLCGITSNPICSSSMTWTSSNSPNMPGSISLRSSCAAMKTNPPS